MHSQLTIRAVSAVAACLGLSSIAGAIGLSDVSLLLRFTSLLAGALLLFGAWLLWFGSQAAAIVLSASALVYVASIVYPALLRHGSGALGALIPSFYLSASIRAAIAAFAYFAVRRLRREA